MSELLKFISENPVVTMFMAWLTFITVCRGGRFVLILVRGWPPEHFDEDWSPEP